MSKGWGRRAERVARREMTTFDLSVAHLTPSPPPSPPLPSPGIAPLNSELMRIILTRGLLQPHLASVKSALKLRLDLILEKVASCPNITVPYPPTGGYFLWLKLLNVASEAAVVSALEKSQGVVVLPGSSCCQPSAPPLDGVFIRVCFACLDTDPLMEAFDRLCTFLH